LSHSKVEKFGETNPKQRGGFAMKKSKFTEEQIAFALRQAEGGTSVGETCRKMGISEVMFYNWNKTFVDPSSSNWIADPSVDKAMLQSVIKNALRPVQ